MSDCWVAFSPRICSGDMCNGEPIREPALVSSTEPCGDRDAEIQHFDQAGRRDHDIGRFYVAVNHASGMCVIEGGKHLHGKIHEHRHRDASCDGCE